MLEIHHSGRDPSKYSLSINSVRGMFQYLTLQVQNVSVLCQGFCLFVLFCFVLFCFVLFCGVLCCVVLCCFVLFCFYHENVCLFVTVLSDFRVADHLKISHHSLLRITVVM